MDELNVMANIGRVKRRASVEFDTTVLGMAIMPSYPVLQRGEENNEDNHERIDLLSGRRRFEAAGSWSKT
jgi:hypothetical protein